ncbi:RluA family pseudouridine synthase [Ruminococcaceae bacterium OttesenSCG-928-N02]|nr:RluA family pseudouridine synthase [Ruminococcaceae bacterium OttesenSCG-928-N02]
MQIRFFVQQAYAGARLRGFLRAQGVSAAVFRRAKVVPGALKVNGLQATATSVLQVGDEITLTLTEKAQEATLMAQDIPLEILAETQHYMAVNKPAGQVVHPTRGYQTGTLAAAYLYELQKRGQAGIPRAVGRLDKNTSGVVVFAKNQFAQHAYPTATRKTYLAIVQGEMPPGEGVFTGSIDFAQGSIIQRAVLPTGKESRTVYKVLFCAQGHTLVVVQPVTGRTHQIRVHFSHAGYPLAGDELYGGRTDYIPRQALHCALAHLPHLAGEEGQGEQMQVYAPPPEDFVRWGQTLFGCTQRELQTLVQENTFLQEQ